MFLMFIPETKLKLDAVESNILLSNPLFGVEISSMSRLLQNMSIG